MHSAHGKQCRSHRGNRRKITSFELGAFAILTFNLIPISVLFCF